jgi:hypothetical protein
VGINVNIEKKTLMNPRLKKIIFSKLNEDLSKVEIILSENKSIWFIDRANKYWYFELEKSGKLWWRYEFFTDFFILFCLEVNEFQPILSEWVEGILNRGVSSTSHPGANAYDQVEGILNCGVSSMETMSWESLIPVEDILNRGVSATGDLGMERITTVEKIFDSNVNMTTRSGHRLHSTVEGILNHGYRKGSRKVDEVLNHKVVSTEYCGIIPNYDLEEVLNREINEIDGGELIDNITLEKVLNHKVVSILPANLQNELIQQVLVNELIYEVESATPLDTPAHDSVDEVLSYKVTRTIPDLNESLTEIDILLNQKS